MTRATPRPDGRKPAEMRPVAIETGATRYAEGGSSRELGVNRELLNSQTTTDRQADGV